MRHTVRLHGVIVGHSDLEHFDAGLRRAWGPFRPGLGYELVQPVFRLFSQAVRHPGGEQDPQLLERYYQARDKLRLELQDAEGRRITTSVIHIVDHTEENGPAALELDVLISDDGYWRKRADPRVN